jgi:UDPglucose 6-dehydrogenase
VGSGVVGSATGTVLSSHGFDVTFADTSPDVVRRLKGQGRQAVEISAVRSPDADVFMISVPTYPYDICKDEAAAEEVDRTMSPLQWCELGIDYMEKAADTVGKWLSASSKYQLVVVRSAVLPGTTEDLVIPTIEKQSGRKAGRDFGVCVNPEYLREKSSVQDIAEPWVTVIGALDKKSGDMLESLYEWTSVPLYTISVREAEMQKFVHNLFNATKISFFNEMRLFCEKIGVDANKIMPIVAKSAEGLWNPEYGTKDYGPFGGKCLPKDTLAFVEWAKRGGMHARMIEASIEVNKLYEKRLQSTPA